MAMLTHLLIHGINIDIGKWFWTIGLYSQIGWCKRILHDKKTRFSIYVRGGGV